MVATMLILMGILAVTLVGVISASGGKSSRRADGQPPTTPFRPAKPAPARSPPSTWPNPASSSRCPGSAAQAAPPNNGSSFAPDALGRDQCRRAAARPGSLPLHERHQQTISRCAFTRTRTTMMFPARPARPEEVSDRIHRRQRRHHIHCAGVCPAGQFEPVSGAAEFLEQFRQLLGQRPDDF